MKAAVVLTLSVTLGIFLSACDKPAESAPNSARTPDAAASDIPLLPVTQGDTWIYEVLLQIPANITSPGAAEVDNKHSRTRTYLGKISPAEGLPAVDCFEVVAPVSPTEREFVEIHPDRILMRGSMILRPETTRPLWFEHPVPFVVAGMKAGTVSPQIHAAGGSLSRQTQVVGRENVTVPAGTFPAIRLLMTGMDGDLELRRTLWFSPGTGIVREEKTRYRLGKLIFRENQQLAKVHRAQKVSH